MRSEALLLLVLAGCGAPDPEDTAIPDTEPAEDTDSDAPDTDTDVGDTDTDVPDTDTDPIDTGGCTPYGPDNGWFHACAEDVPPLPAETGWGPGDAFPELTVRDQRGDEVAIRQFYGRLVLLDVSAVWCAPCRALAPQLEALDQALTDDQVIVLTVLAEDVSGGPATAADVDAWATELGLTGPVAYDPLGGIDDVPEITGYPSTVLIDPTMHVVETDFEKLDAELLARAAAGTVGGTEICDNGLDDDIDLLGDCQDPDCPEEGSCALSQEDEGTLMPCATDGLRGVDVWRITVTGPSARLVIDTVDDAHKFEPMIQRAVALDDRASEGTIVGDDERACTFAPSAWQCPDAFLGTGTWDVYVVPGWGTAGDGACADPTEARYQLRLYGAGSAELLDGEATSATVALYGLG